jgi:hypothetical protein
MYRTFARLMVNSFLKRNSLHIQFNRMRCADAITLDARESPIYWTIVSVILWHHVASGVDQPPAMTDSIGSNASPQTEAALTGADGNGRELSFRGRRKSRRP